MGWILNYKNVLSSAFLFAFGALAAQGDRLEVDQVEFSGLTVSSQQVLESYLELSVGDEFERVKLIRTLSNIENFYQNKGYSEVDVKSEFIRRKNSHGNFENILRILIIEGKPIRVSKVQVLPLGIRTVYFQKYWESKKNKIHALFGLKEGDLFDQDQLNRGKRAVLDFLSSEEFVGARIVDVHVKPGVSHLVDIEISFEMGERVTFGFRGNLFFSKSQLDSFIEEQKLIGFGKDYILFIKNKIEDEYKTQGYMEVKVSPFVFEHQNAQERHITYQIEEGYRIKIEDLKFDGNVEFTQEKLEALYFQQASILLQNRYYVEKDVQFATDKLLEWMKSQGFLSAKIVTINKTYQSVHHSVRLVVYLYEGEQSFVDKIDLLGLHAFSQEEVKKVLAIEEGHPLNLFLFNEGIENLKRLYRSKGYWDAKILNEKKDTVVQYLHENKTAFITLELQEGLAYYVSQIEIEGLQTTQEEVVRRELVLKEFALLEEDKLTESEIRLRKLGIFSVVNFRLLEDGKKTGHKILRISLVEGSPGILAGGVGYRNDLGIRLFGQSAYANLWGKNHTLSLTTNINRRFDPSFCANIDKNNVAHGGPCFLEYRVEFGYLWPWFILGNTPFRPKFSVEKTQFLGFDAFTILLSLGLEKRLLQKYNLVAGLSYHLEQTEQFNSLVPAIDDQTLVIGSLVPSLRLDLRDNALSPTSGFFTLATFEYASPLFLSQGDPFPVAFTRFQYRADAYIPLGKRIFGFFSFRTGFEKNLVLTPPEVSEQDLLARKFAIPLSKQFSLGGAGSLRGFGEQTLNVSDLAIRGTLSYVNYRAQLDFPFAGSLRFGPFLDAANLLKDRFSFGILRYGAGFGFHYISPVGPVNFDWGFNLFPAEGEDPYRFHLSIGVI